MALRAAVDIGGTFTDGAVFDGATGEIRVGKTLTTPGNLVDGIVTSLDAASAPPEAIEVLVHGSTVVINALIERKGARAALITTSGFRDVYEIGRINRPESFNLQFAKHVPLIPRDLVYEVPERLAADGTVQVPLDEGRARDVVVELVARGIESIGVVFLHAYRDPRHELAMGEVIAEVAPHLFVTLSHELTREYREFERTSTTAANAYVGPTVRRYLDDLGATLERHAFGGTLAVMQSSGGLSDVATVKRQGIQMIESGPAGGAVGASALCELLGLERAIAFDMGGTTAKATVVSADEIAHAQEYFVGGYANGLPIRVPVVDIAEVGTGGGSVAWLDAAEGLHVGPRSAGASPGPSCYGLGGTEPTVTDASVVLGQLAPAGTLSGGLRLDDRAATAAIARVAEPLGLSVTRAAVGIVQIAAAAMADAVRAVTTERGLDPRDFSLVCFGGSGPLHASLVARELGMQRVVIPPQAAAFSALGMLLADMRRDYVTTRLERLASVSMASLEDRYRDLERAGRAELRSMGVGDASIAFQRKADMRYVGQEHAVTVGVPASLGDPEGRVVKEAFDRAHERLYSHHAPDQEAEIVSIRVSAIGTVPKPSFAELPSRPPDLVATVASRPVTFDAADGPVPTSVHDRAGLRAGDVVRGPAIIEEPGTSVVLRPEDEATVEVHGCLEIRVGKVEA